MPGGLWPWRQAAHDAFFLVEHFHFGARHYAVSIAVDPLEVSTDMRRSTRARLDARERTIAVAIGFLEVVRCGLTRRRCEHERCGDAAKRNFHDVPSLYVCGSLATIKRVNLFARQKAIAAGIDLVEVLRPIGVRAARFAKRDEAVVVGVRRIEFVIGIVV